MVESFASNELYEDSIEGVTIIIQKLLLRSLPALDRFQCLLGKSTIMRQSLNSIQCMISLTLVRWRKCSDSIMVQVNPISHKTLHQTYSNSPGNPKHSRKHLLARNLEHRYQPPTNVLSIF